MLKNEVKVRHQSVLFIVLLMSVLYFKLGVFQKYGESEFYSSVEHLLFVCYGLSSLFSCTWVVNRKGHERVYKFRDIIEVILYSGLLNAILTTVIFLTFRFVAFLILGYTNWMPPLTGIAFNIATSFLLSHLAISGLFLAYNNMRLHHQAHTNQLKTENALTALKLRHLQAQFTPHFLFNNLNILAGLIPVDAKKAEHYVLLLSALYRYVTQHKDEELVSLEQELKFVEQYSELMMIRFANAYRVSLVKGLSLGPDVFVSPGAVQSCVENAIKHNVGMQNSPLDISVTVESTRVTISNRVRQKRQHVASTQKGLKHLTQLYAGLTDRPVEVTQYDELFVVSIPLILENSGN